MFLINKVIIIVSIRKRYDDAEKEFIAAKLHLFGVRVSHCDNILSHNHHKNQYHIEIEQKKDDFATKQNTNPNRS